ncbi:hypothetical protein HDU96_005470 [Phlyctochytrium bullatum]|nr:hypothetical protein HDU96_005470 [Phlyctochytrium bullatum]
MLPSDVALLVALELPLTDLATLLRTSASIKALYGCDSVSVARKHLERITRQVREDNKYDGYDAADWHFFSFSGADFCALPASYAAAAFDVTGDPASTHGILGPLHGMALQRVMFCREPNLRIFRLLISKGADCGARGKEKKTVLWWAASRGLNQFVQELLAQGVKIEDSEDVLARAAAFGDLEMVKMLMDHGVKVCPTVQESITRKKPADPNATTSTGFPLWHAVTTAADAATTLRLCTLLVSHGAQVNKIAWMHKQRTSLHMVRDAATVAFLIDSGAKLDASDLDGWTALHHVCGGGTAHVAWGWHGRVVGGGARAAGAWGKGKCGVE